jgi:hypothetical protein
MTKPKRRRYKEAQGAYVSVWMTPELKRALRLEAALQDKGMSALIRETLERKFKVAPAPEPEPKPEPEAEVEVEVEVVVPKPGPGPLRRPPSPAQQGPAPVKLSR